jgi:long-chain acyl-CoA synthetase
MAHALFFAESLDTFMAGPAARAAHAVHLGAAPVAEVPAGRVRQDAAGQARPLLRIPLLGKLVAARRCARAWGWTRCIAAGSGSAPIPPDLIRWYRRIGLALYEGYGMTEDSSYSHTSTAEHNAPGYVGVPMGRAGAHQPGGRDPDQVARAAGGLLQAARAHAESFTEDGFFRTGDLGERAPTAC